MRVIRLLLIGALALSARPVSAQALDSTLAPLAGLLGGWMVPDQVAAQRPELAGQYIVHASPVVGGHAIRYREHVPFGEPAVAELEGLIVWHPAEEHYRLFAAAGRGDPGGRIFVGTLTPLADGRIEKVYDVYYRTAADVPGEEHGGLRRRYREIIEFPTVGRMVFTLDWWVDGRWQPFGAGRYELGRAVP